MVLLYGCKVVHKKLWPHPVPCSMFITTHGRLLGVAYHMQAEETKTASYLSRTIRST
eukprot:COSAG02_NODE_4099_length_5777_cov_3.988728_2_plen_57_part_00